MRNEDEQEKMSFVVILLVLKKKWCQELSINAANSTMALIKLNEIE